MEVKTSQNNLNFKNELKKGEKTREINITGKERTYRRFLYICHYE